MTFVDPTEATRSGIEEVITSTIGNRVTAKNRPRVRIPPTPPKPRTFYVRGFPFFRHGLPSNVTGMERNDAPGGSSLFLAASTVLFCGSEISLERVLTRKIVLYIFVCKTHKNGKIWSKFR